MNPLKLSFEMFPPTDAAASESFTRGLDQLAGFDPAFLSITYGANGGGRARSVSCVDAVLDGARSRYVAAHVTAAGQDRAALEALLKHWRARGLSRLVALRGDGVPGSADPMAFPDAVGVVEAAARIGYRDISIACYPEGHPLSVSPYLEMEHLRRKLDAGARRAISQFFFDAEVFLRFRDRCHALGITQSIVPGVLVPTAYNRVRAFATKCGASVPAWLDERFDGLGDDPFAASQVAVATTVALADRLCSEGCGHIHIYTLNRFSEASAIARCLGAAAPSAPPRDLTRRKVA